LLRRAYSKVGVLPVGALPANLAVAHLVRLDMQLVQGTRGHPDVVLSG